jgi:hypothetical protein
MASAPPSSASVATPTAKRRVVSGCQRPLRCWVAVATASITSSKTISSAPVPRGVK